MINHFKSKHVEEARKCFAASTEKVDVKKQTTMAAFIESRCSGDHAGQITNLIAQFIARDIRPVRIVEGEGFQHLLQFIEPNYCVPSRPYIRCILKQIAFMTDIWTISAS